MLWFHPVNMTLVTLASEAIGDLVFSSLVTHLNDASEPDSLLLHRWTYATDQDFRSGLPSTLKTQIKAFYKVKKTKDVAANKAKQKETVDGTVARLNDELMAVAMRLMLQVLEGDHGLQKRAEIPVGVDVDTEDADMGDKSVTEEDTTMASETPDKDKQNSMQDYAKTLSTMSDWMAGMHGSHKYSLPAPAPHRLGQLSGIYMNEVVGPASETLRTQGPAILINVFD